MVAPRAAIDLGHEIADAAAKPVGPGHLQASHPGQFETSRIALNHGLRRRGNGDDASLPAPSPLAEAPRGQVEPAACDAAESGFQIKPIRDGRRSPERTTMSPRQSGAGRMG